VLASTAAPARAPPDTDAQASHVDLRVVRTTPHQVERECIESLHRWKAGRDESAVRKALDVAQVAAERENLMPTTIEAAKAGHDRRVGGHPARCAR
jgi:methylmalonyl-CoA mutase N-terminal domain/subunit